MKTKETKICFFKKKSFCQNIWRSLNFRLSSFFNRKLKFTFKVDDRSKVIKIYYINILIQSSVHSKLCCEFFWIYWRQPKPTVIKSLNSAMIHFLPPVFHCVLNEFNLLFILIVTWHCWIILNDFLLKHSNWTVPIQFTVYFFIKESIINIKNRNNIGCSLNIKSTYKENRFFFIWKGKK